jgi:ResB-like family.
MMRILLKLGIIFSVVAAVFVAVFASRQVFFKTADADFKNSTILWILIAIFAVGTIITIITLLAIKPSVRKIGFYIIHVGIVLILIGSFTYYLFGVKVKLNAYENENGSTAQNHAKIIETSPLRGDDFRANFDNISVGVKDITCRYYDPEYVLLKITDPTSVVGEVLKDEIYPDKGGTYDFGEYGKFNKKELVSENGIYALQQFDGGVVAKPMLSQGGKSVLEYVEVSAVLQDRKTGDNITKKFTINNPVNFSGWKIILMAADEDSGAVQFFVKYDPGEYITLTGMWLTIIGAFACAFLTFKTKKAEGQE